jgi:hypothetical protein
MMNELLNVAPEDLPTTPSPLDAVVNPGLQRAFLEGRRLPVPNLGSGARAMSPQLRRLARTGGYETVLEFLAHYVALVLPDPVATEGSFWAVETALDSDIPAEEPQQLARLSVHGVAVATVVEDPEGDGENPLVCLALAPEPVVDRTYSPEPTYLDVDGAPVPAQQAEGSAEDLSRQLASDPELLAAARRAVVGLMRRGPAGRARHERDLADAVFTTLVGIDGLADPRVPA